MKINLTEIKRRVSGGKFFLLSIMLVVASAVGSLPISKSAHAAIGSITQYTTPDSGSFPNNIAWGPDGNIWYTGTGPTINTRVGKMTTSGSFTLYHNTPSGVSGNPAGISRGADGNVWFGKGNSIIKMSTSGVVLSQYSLSGIGATAGAQEMILGGDGAIWFYSPSGGKIGRITTDGVITAYTVGSNVYDITLGTDSNIWFTYSYGSSTNYIAKITSSGVQTVYSSFAPYSKPWGITAGPDGNMWFTENLSRKIGKINTLGIVTEYSLPATASPKDITVGSDGALWFTGMGVGKIGRITTSGIITDYSVPGSPTSDGIEHIITGADGAVWYLDWVNDKIGRIATELTNQTISFTSTAPNNAVIGGLSYTPTASSTSNLPVEITVDASSTGVCVIDSSGVVSFPGYGTCTLSANQAGDLDYNPAPQVQQSFTVLPVDANTELDLDCDSTTTVNSMVTCEITVTNNGPAVATSASLTAIFSNTLTNASINEGGAISGQYVTWSTPSLASGDSVTLTFTATASVAGKARFNAALLQTSPDPDISNNIVDATIVMS